MENLEVVPFQFIQESYFPYDENDKLVCTLKRLNPHENANPPAWGIKFDQEVDKDV